MEILVPSTKLVQSAAWLDPRHRRIQLRLAVRVLRILTGWYERCGRQEHHPAAHPWRGYEILLGRYAAVLLVVSATADGVNVNRRMVQVVRALEGVQGPVAYPAWWGGDIHARHRRMLLARQPGFYRRWGWPEIDNLAPDGAIGVDNANI